MDKLENLERQVAAALPGVPGTRCYVGIKKDGVHPGLYAYFAYASGPGVAAEVGPAQGSSPEEVAQGLKAAWAKARRAFETAKVLGECKRLSGYTLTDEDLAFTENELLHAKGSFAFDNLAGRARKSAQALAPTHQQVA